MIDVFAPAGLLPTEGQGALAQELARAVLRVEGVPPGAAAFEANTAAYVHELPPTAISTAAEQAPAVVRVVVTTPPGALDRTAQRELVAAATDAVARAAGDPGLAARTWVVLTEAAEGGWGIAGTAYGRPEFAALVAGIAG